MVQRFGSIKKGEEDSHFPLMFPMESNLLKLHREDEKRDSRRAIEAIHICLLTIDGYLTDTEYDLEPFISEENQALAEGLLMSFDPFSNEEIRTVKCLLRIERSIEMWLKARGTDGYFQYIEDLMGDTVKTDTRMEYMVLGDMTEN